MLKFPFCLKMVQSGDIYIRDEMIEKRRRMWNRFICLTDEAVLSSIFLLIHLKSPSNRHNIFITNGYPDRKKEMRARIYNRKEKRYYISEIYGILNCGMEICLADDIDDSVLKEFSYITGDYISSEGHMCLSESGSKQIKIIFESDWAKPIEMILLAPKFIQLVPPAENYLANLFDASVFIKDCMVYFYDSYMEAIPSQYNGSYFSAMGMRWRHYCV